MKQYSVTQKKNRANDTIRGTMKRKKMSQEEVAYRLGMERSCLARRLSGQTEWTLSEFILVCEVLEINIGDFVL